VTVYNVSTTVHPVNTEYCVANHLTQLNTMNAKKPKRHNTRQTVTRAQAKPNE